MKHRTRRIAIAALACALLAGLAAAAYPRLPAPELAPPLESDHAYTARQAICAALAGDANRLEAIATRARATETALEPTSATHPVASRIALLQAWCTPEGPSRDRILRRILGSDPEPAVLQRARHALATAPVHRIRAIRRQDRLNRFALAFNSFSRTATQLVIGNIQGAVQAVVDTLFLWEPLTRLTPRNRQAADLYERSRDRIEAAGYKHTDLERYARRIARKQRREAVNDRIARGRWHLANNRPELARSSFHNAEKADPEDSRARRLALQAARRLSARRRNQMATMHIAQPLPQRNSSEGRAIASLAASALAGDTPALAQQAAGFIDNHPRSPFAADAAYTVLAADGIASPSIATAARTFLKNQAPKSDAARRLRAFASCIDANPRARLDYAARMYRRDLWGYVFTGDRNDAQSLATYTARGLTHRIVSSLGLLLPVQWVIRGVVARFGRPVEDNAWRDAAVALLERSPHVAPAIQEQTARRLSRSCERTGDFDKALHWHRVATGTPDEAYEMKIRELRARQELDIARIQAQPHLKIAALQNVAETNPDTRAGKKARKLLDKAEKKAPVLYRISRRELASFPDLWRDRGLNMRPQWFDGKANNGELTDEGVRFYDPAGKHLRYVIRETDGDQEYIVRPDPPSLKQLQEALHQWVRESRTRTRMQRALRNPALGWSLQGSAGASGVDIYPALRPAPFDEESLPLYQTITGPRR